MDLIDILPRKAVYAVVQRGMDDQFHRTLIAKYLPKMRSPSKSFNERYHKLNHWARVFVQQVLVAGIREDHNSLLPLQWLVQNANLR